MSESKPVKASRQSYAATTNRQRNPAPENKPLKRHSFASSNIGSPSFAQRTKTSSSRLSDAKLEESNISVYVRCRSRNDRELKENSGVVVSTTGHMGKEVVLQTGPMSVSNKTYTFDRVFGAESDQETVYDGIAQSVLTEMLQGYNCTVFAYGQTGTGKTYTMSGDISNASTVLSPDAGIIPRTLVDLFKKLDKTPDFSVKISFIELYNEELRDLLLASDQEKKTVRIFEDPLKKSITVQGMEEVYIKTAEEGMKVLSDGSFKRQVAATQCNDLSSRSHSVFTITVIMKEIDPISGEEYLKTGKLNLVDLAGSENINRSGAENKRAREAGMINQSLLTLGRVINALVDQSPHIPYRESKLTRLLQDSLGGRTKTCIIATISPAKVSLDETISTLEYANRAKSIKNKPQVNQTMSKKMLIKEYVQEIERLRNDLIATRSKNGIYVTEENWQQVTAESESRRIHVEEQKLRINLLEEQIKKFKHDFEDHLNHIKKIEEDLATSKRQRQVVENQLMENETKLKEAEEELEIQLLMNKNHEETETKLNDTYFSLVKLTDEVADAKEQLLKILSHKDLEAKANKNALFEKKRQINSNIDILTDRIDAFACQGNHLSGALNSKFSQMIEIQQAKLEEKSHYVEINSLNLGSSIDTILKKVLNLTKSTDDEIDGIDTLKSQIKDELITDLNNLKQESLENAERVKEEIESIDSTVKSGFEEISNTFNETVQNVQSQLDVQVSDILTLKARVVDHHAKYNSLLEEQMNMLVNIKESERQNSELEKEELFSQISLLIDSHESRKLDRLSEKVDLIQPALSKIIQKQTSFSVNYESFVKDKWVPNQQKFQQGFAEQADVLQQDLDSRKSTIISRNASLSSFLKDQISQNDLRFNKSIENLDNKMRNLNEFAIKLKKLNQENSNFTQDQVSSIKSQISQSLSTISDGFQSFGKELSSTKPELIDSYLELQKQYLSKFQSISQESLHSLSKEIAQWDYHVDEHPLPTKRQKLGIVRMLPKSKTREEIIQLRHKEPLKELNKDINISDEKGDKFERSKPSQDSTLKKECE